MNITQSMIINVSSLFKNQISSDKIIFLNFVMKMFKIFLENIKLFLSKSIKNTSDKIKFHNYIILQIVINQYSVCLFDQLFSILFFSCFHLCGD